MSVRYRCSICHTIVLCSPNNITALLGHVRKFHPEISIKSNRILKSLVPTINKKDEESISTIIITDPDNQETITSEKDGEIIVDGKDQEKGLKLGKSVNVVKIKKDDNEENSYECPRPECDSFHLSELSTPTLVSSVHISLDHLSSSSISIISNLFTPVSEETISPESEDTTDEPRERTTTEFYDTCSDSAGTIIRRNANSLVKRTGAYEKLRDPKRKKRYRKRRTQKTAAELDPDAADMTSLRRCVATLRIAPDPNPDMTTLGRQHSSQNMAAKSDPDLTDMISLYKRRDSRDRRAVDSDSSSTQTVMEDLDTGMRPLAKDNVSRETIANQEIRSSLKRRCTTAKLPNQSPLIYEGICTVEEKSDSKLDFPILSSSDSLIVALAREQEKLAMTPSCRQLESLYMSKKAKLQSKRNRKFTDQNIIYKRSFNVYKPVSGNGPLLYEAIVDKFRLGKTKVKCPFCGAIDTPIIKYHSQKIFRSRFRAALFLACWPSSFLSSKIIGRGLQYHYCAVCYRYFGIYCEKTFVKPKKSRKQPKIFQFFERLFKK